MVVAALRAKLLTKNDDTLRPAQPRFLVAVLQHRAHHGRSLALRAFLRVKSSEANDPSFVSFLARVVNVCVSCVFAVLLLWVAYRLQSREHWRFAEVVSPALRSTARHDLCRPGGGEKNTGWNGGARRVAGSDV